MFGSRESPEKEKLSFFVLALEKRKEWGERICMDVVLFKGNDEPSALDRKSISVSLEPRVGVSDY